MSSNPFLANNPFVTNDVSTAAASVSERVASDDLDLSAKTALEVKITWGEQVLFISHLSPARDVFVGDESEGPVDYKLPTPRVQIARVEGDSIVALTDDGMLPLSRGQSHVRKVSEMTVRIASVAAAKRARRR